jgi:hypothetical protein
MAKNLPVPSIIGRPTDYRPEYCELLINHLAEGLSFESFAAVVDTCKQTIYTWLEKFPEFSAARANGNEKSRLYWERLGRDHILNSSIVGVASKSLNATVWIFNMKNRFPDEWRDKKEITGDIKTGPDLTGLMSEAADDPQLLAALRLVGDKLSKKG